MTLSEFAERHGRGAIQRLQLASGLAYSTVHAAVRGTRTIEQYETAKRLSEATRELATEPDAFVPVDQIWGPALRGEASLSTAEAP